MIVVGNGEPQRTLLKARFVIFRCQKYVKKGYMEMTKKIYLETLKKCPGSLCFTLLFNLVSVNNNNKSISNDSWKFCRIHGNKIVKNKKCLNIWSFS